jgi:hypothetical protein
MVEYVLKENLLNPQEPGERIALVVNARTHTESDLAEAIAKRNIGISKVEALAMLEAESEILKEWLAEGCSINMRLAHFHPSVPGTYGEGEFPKEAVIRITPSKEVVELARKIPLRHVEPISPIHIESIHDVKSDTINDKITGGGTVKIWGHNIRITGIDPTIRAEFVKVDTPTVNYPVPAQDLIVNNPSELIIIAPAMPSGEKVRLKITTQYSAGKRDLKVPRSTTFEKKLTVV